MARKKINQEFDDDDDFFEVLDEEKEPKIEKVNENFEENSNEENSKEENSKTEKIKNKKSKNDSFVDDEIEELDEDEQLIDEDQKIIINNSENENNYLLMAQRIQAEFDNFRKRKIEEDKSARNNTIAFAVEKLLPITDSINSAKKQVSDENFLKALELLQNQTMQAFESLNVKQIEALHQKFNPNLHNVVLTECNEDIEDDVITDVYQEGFMINDKVIRYSVVKINKLN